MWVGVKDSVPQASLLLCHHTSAPEEMGPWSGGELSSSLSLYGWNLQSTVRRGATRKRKILHPETIFMFTISQADCSPKFGVMPQCWCRRVVLCVELGVLVAVLAAGSTAQLFERRQAGSSCYGGFDLYFVLDKWVLLFLEICVTHRCFLKAQVHASFKLSSSGNDGLLIAWQKYANMM